MRSGTSCESSWRTRTPKCPHKAGGPLAPPPVAGPTILGDIDPTYWLHIWPSDRPLPTTTTAVQ
jgi:hypothetical protein